MKLSEFNYLKEFRYIPSPSLLNEISSVIDSNKSNQLPISLSKKEIQTLNESIKLKECSENTLKIILKVRKKNTENKYYQPILNMIQGILPPEKPEAKVHPDLIERRKKLLDREASIQYQNATKNLYQNNQPSDLLMKSDTRHAIDTTYIAYTLIVTTASAFFAGKYLGVSLNKSNSIVSIFTYLNLFELHSSVNICLTYIYFFQKCRVLFGGSFLVFLYFLWKYFCISCVNQGEINFMQIKDNSLL